MQCIIFSEEHCNPENLYPFHLTRHIQEIRLGILTIREKWERTLGLEGFSKWEGDYKETERSFVIDNSIPSGTYLLLHANILPNPELAQAIRALQPGEALIHEQAGAIALHFDARDVSSLHKIKVHQTIPYAGPLLAINAPWHIFQLNDQAIRLDFELLTANRESAPISSTNQVLGNHPVFLEEGVQMEACVLNASAGPIYIGANAEIMEGSCLRGPVAIGANAVLKMGSKIYGATTIGPYCMAGGEIKNTVMMGYSNKAHEGYLGDAVIGEWCNLGAGTSASNVKNNAGPILIYHPPSEGGRASVGNKCGLIMGDYSRSAINTCFNTGTVVGVSSSVFGTGLLPKYIPHFSWGAEGIRKYELNRAL
ncbi:MAG TPA: putative sugar nucleotidyl transferase, partial [Flavihumibacter sp.]